MTEPIISVRNLVVEFPLRRGLFTAVDDVSFDIMPGEILGVVGESGAGLVTATCTLEGDLKALEIDPSIFDPSQKEVVEDLILAAIKDAQKKAADRKQDEMKRLYESLGLPADMKLPI